jgi:hypothetical protein
MTDTVVQKATGESLGGLGWMVVGAAALAVFVAPLVSRYLGISATIALIVAGVALAYFGTGGIRKAGQGAAVFGIASWAMGYLAPMLGGLGGSKSTKNASPSYSGVVI